MKVLIGCLFFRDYTGSELYVYELAKGLKKKNCKVTIVSADIDFEMRIKAEVVGVEVITPQELKGREFDIIHCQHQPVIEMLLRVYPNTPKVCTIHSEILKYEEPIFDKSIKQYIAIRPSIFELLKFRGIDEKRIKLIYNPIDNQRFTKLDNPPQDSAYDHLLFVGSVDYLRKRTIADLIDYTQKEGLGLKIVGNHKNTNITELIKHKHISFFPQTWNVEKFVHQCKFTASILLGRTTIEGWLCGKAGWIYTIDANGYILNKEITQPPTPKELEKFYASNVVDSIYNLLKRVYENPF